jgi:hypothetical protein
MAVAAKGRWALFQLMGAWRYEERGGSEEEVRLWESDQGYSCRKKNVLTDVEKVLPVVKTFYEAGSYDDLGRLQ